MPFTSLTGEIHAMSGSTFFRTLDTSPSFILGHEYERVILIDRHTGARHDIGRHHGDPTAGLIGPREAWFVAAGEGLTLFDFTNGIRELMRAPRCFRVHAMSMECDGTIRVLVDPWSDDASVWRLDAGRMSLVKLRDGPSMRGLPYRDDVEF